MSSMNCEIVSFRLKCVTLSISYSIKQQGRIYTVPTQYPRFKISSRVRYNEIRDHGPYLHCTHSSTLAVKSDIMSYGIMGQDDVCVLRVGLRSRIKMDSKIFRSGPSFATCKIFMEMLLLLSCTSGCLV